MFLRVGSLRGVLLPVAIAAALADAPPTEGVPSDVGAVLAELRAEVAAIRAARDSEWLDRARAEQVRAVARDVLADSAARTSFLAAGGQAGYEPGRGFFVADPGGAFTLGITGFTQQRFVANFGTDAAERTPYGVNAVWGFEVHRTQVFFAGTAVDPSITYLLGLQLDPQPDPGDMPIARTDPAEAEGGTLEINYLNVTKHLSGGWWVQAGNIFTPWDLESHLFCAANVQSGEYSVLNFLFGAGYTSGVALGVDGDDLRWSACYGNVLGLGPNQWNSAYNQSYAFSTRLNWRLAGDWAQYADESSFRGQPFGAFLGLALRAENGRATTPAGFAWGAQYGATADVTLMFGGANVMAELVWIQDYVQPGQGAWGAWLQGGAFVTDQVEAFAGWTVVSLLGTQQYGTAGVNWYLHRDALKVTAMAMIAGGGDEANFYSLYLPGMGLLDADHPNNAASMVLQLQMAF